MFQWTFLYMTSHIFMKKVFAQDTSWCAITASYSMHNFYFAGYWQIFAKKVVHTALLSSSSNWVLLYLQDLSPYLLTSLVPAISDSTVLNSRVSELSICGLGSWSHGCWLWFSNLHRCGSLAPWCPSLPRDLPIVYLGLPAAKHSHYSPRIRWWLICWMPSVFNYPDTDRSVPGLDC